MNRQHFLEEMCTQEVPPPRMANPCLQAQGRPVARIDEINETKSFTIPTPRSAGNNPQNLMVGQPKDQIEEMHFDKQTPCALFFLTMEDEQQNRSVFLFWLPFGSNALDLKKWRWLLSVDDLKTSRSIFGHLFPNFETLDAKIASSLKEIIPNSNLKKRFNLVAQ